MPGGYDNRTRTVAPVTQEPLGPIRDLPQPRSCRVSFNWRQPFSLNDETTLQGWLIAVTDTQGLVAFRMERRAAAIWASREKITLL